MKKNPTKRNRSRAIKIVFLDRDGVINTFPGNGSYVTKIKDFHFIPGSLEAIRTLTQRGYHIFVISNQAGVSKGVYTQAKLNQITRYMLKRIRRSQGKIKKVFYCIHRQEEGCLCRKPRIGSVRKALQSLNKTIRHARCAFFIGDTEGDIQTGHNAGCKTIFVLSGRENRRHLRSWKAQPDFIAQNLREASRIIEGIDRSSKERRP
jgi:D-glycero-D-manno-heptose 1,7-bisphosphate phosphatase